MTSTELEYAEKRMKQKWYDLVMAEQQGASQQVLERMYNAYILAVEEYNHCSRQLQDAPLEASPVPVEKPGRAPASTERTGTRKRKAS